MPIRTDYTPKQKPKSARGWACPNCQRLFAYNDNGKALASVCCTCPRCKKPCDRYIGAVDKLCSRCKAEVEWQRAIDNLTNALTVYEILCHGLKRVDPVLEGRLAEFMSNRHEQ